MLNCAQFEALELLCLRAYPLKVVLRDQRKFLAIAVDIAAVEGVEKVCFKTANALCWVESTKLAALEVLESSAPFTYLDLAA